MYTIHTFYLIDICVSLFLLFPFIFTLPAFIKFNAIHSFLGVAYFMLELYTNAKYFAAKLANDTPAMSMASSIISKLNEQLPSTLRLSVNFLGNLSSATASSIEIFVTVFSTTVLREILPQKDFKVWKIFASAFNVLVSHEVHMEELDQAENDYAQFLINFHRLYPTIPMPFNFHLVQHAKENILDFGPSCQSWWYA